MLKKSKALRDGLKRFTLDDAVGSNERARAIMNRSIELLPNIQSLTSDELDNILDDMDDMDNNELLKLLNSREEFLKYVNGVLEQKEAQDKPDDGPDLLRNLADKQRSNRFTKPTAKKKKKRRRRGVSIYDPEFYPRTNAALDAFTGGLNQGGKGVNKIAGNVLGFFRRKRSNKSSSKGLNHALSNIKGKTKMKITIPERKVTLPQTTAIVHLEPVSEESSAVAGAKATTERKAVRLLPPSGTEGDRATGGREGSPGGTEGNLAVAAPVRREESGPSISRRRSAPAAGGRHDEGLSRQDEEDFDEEDFNEEDFGELSPSSSSSDEEGEVERGLEGDGKGGRGGSKKRKSTKKRKGSRKRKGTKKKTPPKKKKPPRKKKGSRKRKGSIKRKGSTTRRR